MEGIDTYSTPDSDTNAEPEDNWRHRSAKMRCRTCMFFVAKLRENMSDKDVLIGRCRERSPTMKGWPAMFPTDWCGEHKIDEEKI